jgi:hypothetical protein
MNTLGETKMYDMFVIDVGGHNTNIARVQEQYPHAQVTRYFHSMLATVMRCVNKSRTSHVWIVASCSDCAEFDFDWYPVPWESNQIHCWAAGDQKFGDVLLVPVDEFVKQSPKLLEWFADVNYHVPGPQRLAWPRVHVGDQDLTTAIIQTEFESEYALFDCNTNTTHVDTEPGLWGENPHQLISFSKDNSISLVPKTAQSHLKTQIYDYQHLVRVNSVPSTPQDIVFISYDEPQADQNWNILCARFPYARRVHGVDGMEYALKAAARASTTPWFYATFAKTRLHEDWDFSFVPDRWQAPKQYIFNALNASNGLCYGHMGIIMYHKESVLNSKPWAEIGGMDFTMSFDTESIPLTSVYGEFAITPYHAWRTAFREVSKLCQWQLDGPSVETDYRIHVWKTHATGPNAEWVLRGAQDGAQFFSENIWNNDELKKAFRWEWLRAFFQSRYELDQ